MSAQGAPMAVHAVFLHWGVLQISLANLAVIAVMLVLFGLALVLPFPHAHPSTASGEHDDARD